MTATRNRVVASVLLIGFLAFTIAVLLAHASPPTGYELSIYGESPIEFWIGIAIAFVAGVFGLFTSSATLREGPSGRNDESARSQVNVSGLSSRRLRDGAGVLVGVSLLAVIAVPLIRSYAFYGGGDSMSHLGWAREISSGVIDPGGIVYPAGHIIGVVLTALTGHELTTTLQFVPTMLFPAVYLLAMPLCVALITDSRWAVPVGLLTAVLLIPINKISVHVVLHPSSQAILFSPFVLYLLFRYLTEGRDGFPLRTPMGAAFALAGIGLILVHPQEAMTFLSMVIAFVALQWIIRRAARHHPIAKHRPLGIHAFVLTAIFLIWTIRHERAVGRFEGVIDGFLTVGATAGDQGSERGTSLVALGGSPEELFIKLFAVSVVFCLLAGGLMLAMLLGRTDQHHPWRNATVSYLIVGLIPPGILFALIFLAQQGDHYFRFHGFIMAYVALLGAIAFVIGIQHLIADSADERIFATGSASRAIVPSRFTDRDTSITQGQVVAVVIVVALLMIGAQLLIVHHSPYMYQSNKQITDAEFTGHEIIFEHHDDETAVVGLRKGQRRFIDAHHGRDYARAGLDFPGYRTGVTGEVFNTNLSTHFDDDTYLVIQSRNERQELELYNELRYTRAGFERLQTDPAFSRVQDNGDVRLYRIRGA